MEAVYRGYMGIPEPIAKVWGTSKVTVWGKISSYTYMLAGGLPRQTPLVYS